jgi:cytochrome P450
MTDRAFPSFPAPRTCPFHPPESYAAVQREPHLPRIQLASGRPAVLVTRHEDVRRLLDDPRLSADERLPGYPYLYAGAFASPLKGTFMRVDGEPHVAVRRMLARDFTVKRAEGLRAHVAAVVDECLDAMAAGPRPVDLVAALAFPVPSRTICHLLGVPYADRDVFEKNTRAMINHKSSQDEVQAAMGAIFAYLDELLSRKQVDPQDDLISRLVTEELLPGHVGRQELITIILILLVGGHETTATMIGLGVFALLEHDEPRRELQAHPELWPQAIEELLRHQTIAQSPMQRVALADLEIGGELIRAGEGVVLELAIANRDPAAFADADRLDIHRNARGHVAFSHGAHHCLGHALARVELEVVFHKLFTRLPALALAVPRDQVPVRPPTVGLFGVEELPVTW